MYLYTHLISFDSVLYKSHTTPLPSIVLLSSIACQDGEPLVKECVPPLHRPKSF